MQLDYDIFGIEEYRIKEYARGFNDGALGRKPPKDAGKAYALGYLNSTR